MGFVVNRRRFKDNQPGPDAWELEKTFTEVRTSVPIDTTGKTEMLVVCDDRCSSLFAICELGTGKYGGWLEEQINIVPSMGTGTGYDYTIQYDSRGPWLYITGSSRATISSSAQNLSSVNTKVYMR